MTTHFEQISYCIPSHFIPYLINGDCTNLTDDEINEIDSYLKNENLGFGHWSYDSEAESYFAHGNDVNSMGGDVTDLVWNKRI